MQYGSWTPGAAVKIASFSEWVEVYLQVSGAAAFFVASDRQTLEQSAAVPQGLQFTQASTSPPYKLTWIGDLWVLANAPGSVIEIMQVIKPGGGAVA
jgi:hypothetical protein